MMNKKTITIIALMVVLSTPFCQFTLAKSNPGQIYEGVDSLVYRNVTVYAPAVAQTESGYVGVISTITVTIQNNGSGRVFVDTLPLTQVDMQGSARLAVKVASTLVRNDINCTVDPSKYDYFFVVRTSAPIIGGPSAGAVMTVATIALLENWTIDNQTIMTGMINPDGSIGPIGGIPQKIDAAWSVGAGRFLIPKGQGTYTEQVTIFTSVTRSVYDYAMDNYGIEVVEVAEINEALENFTGHGFTFEESENQITTEDYNNSMKPLASRLLDEAYAAYNNASSRLQDSKIETHDPLFYTRYLEDEFLAANSTLKDSQNWYDENMYYTSTSKSFQSLIDSRFISYALNYYDIGYDYIEDLLDDVQSLYDNTSTTAKNAQINGYITLQSVGAAQRRASEAKYYFDLAKESYNDNELITYKTITDFLYDIAFVVERCNSIEWWIDIGTKFNDTGNITTSTIENLALEYIEEAQQSAIYSEIIIDEIGTTYTLSEEHLNRANVLIETARSDIESGLTAAALFEALEALVRANLALELIGTTSEEKLDLANKTANSNIANIRKQGIEPILAVSYYEYAESLRNETSYDYALMYYKYSGMIAGAIGYTNITYGTASSRYVGIPEINTPNYNWIIEIGAIIAAGFLGGLAGIGIGLIIAGFYSKKQNGGGAGRQPPSYQRRKQYYPGDQLPRSIRDYNKKNK